MSAVFWALCLVSTLLLWEPYAWIHGYYFDSFHTSYQHISYSYLVTTSNHSLKYLMSAYYLPALVFQQDKNLCLHGTYILVGGADTNKIINYIEYQKLIKCYRKKAKALAGGSGEKVQCRRREQVMYIRRGECSVRGSSKCKSTDMGLYCWRVARSEWLERVSEREGIVGKQQVTRAHKVFRPLLLKV